MGGENCGGIRGHTPTPPRQPSPAVISFFMALRSFADLAQRAYRLKAGNSCQTAPLQFSPFAHRQDAAAAGADRREHCPVPLTASSWGGHGRAIFRNARANVKDWPLTSSHRRLPLGCLPPRQIGAGSPQIISVESMTPEARAAMAEASSKARPTAQQRAEFTALVRGWQARPGARLARVVALMSRPAMSLSVCIG
jgi:hypothetical protein